jgi:hypothetical protein
MVDAEHLDPEDWIAIEQSRETMRIFEENIKLKAELEMLRKQFNY